MSSSLKRIGAIFVKELQDIRTNTNVLLMYVLPVIIVVIYKQFISGFPVSWILGFGVVMLAASAGIYIPAMLIAEEKEKKTLEVLVLSPARPIEVFTGKGLLTFVTILPIAFILALISGTGLENIGTIIIATILASIVSIFLGMIVGLLSQNQMATGVIGFPLIMPLIMVPVLAVLGNALLYKAALFIPTYYLFQMINLGLKGKGLLELAPYVGALSGMVIMAFSILLVTYKKKGIE